MTSSPSDDDDAPDPNTKLPLTNDGKLYCMNCYRVFPDATTMMPQLINFIVICATCANKVLGATLDPDHYRDAH